MLDRFDKLIIYYFNSLVWYMQLKHKVPAQNIFFWIQIMILAAISLWTYVSYIHFFMLAIPLSIFLLLQITMVFRWWSYYNDTSLKVKQKWNSDSENARMNDRFSRLGFVFLALINFIILLIPESNFLFSSATASTMLLLAVSSYFECTTPMNYREDKSHQPAS